MRVGISLLVPLTLVQPFRLKIKTPLCMLKAQQKKGYACVDVAHPCIDGTYLAVVTPTLLLHTPATGRR